MADAQLIALADRAVDANVRSIAKRIYDDGWTGWARVWNGRRFGRLGLEEMMVELSSQPRPKASAVYDVVYFEASACVHSTVSSLYGHMADLDDRQYRLLPSKRIERVERTLLVANMAMLLSLAAADDRMGFGIGEQLQVIWDRLAA
jgi:hypothetical protein